jgi:hypothetical protein
MNLLRDESASECVRHPSPGRRARHFMPPRKLFVPWAFAPLSLYAKESTALRTKQGQPQAASEALHPELKHAPMGMTFGIVAEEQRQQLLAMHHEA